MATIVLTGGGTAGHITPNLSLLPELKKHFDKILYVGGKGMERALAEKAGLKFFEVTTVKLDRNALLKNVKIPFSLAKGISEAKKLFEDLSPDVVFSKGGYVALPACFAAKKLGIPVVVHESDYSLGLANKIVIPFARKTLTSFKETPNGIFTGNPIREEILKGSPFSARKKYNLSKKLPLLLIVGGSLGASAINTLIYSCLDELVKKYEIVHVAGKSGDKSVKRDGYLSLEYAEDIGDLFAAADLVVSRGGSNTLNELACLGKRALIIPLPKGASRGDQLENALSYQKNNFFSVLRQEEATKEEFLRRLTMLQESALSPKRIDGLAVNRRIVNEIVEVI